MARKIDADYVQRGDLPSIPPDQIVVNEIENTRRYKPNVSRLVESFLKYGQLEACVVKPIPGDHGSKVQLVAGYRRWRAAMEIWKQQEAAGHPVEERFKLKCEVQAVASDKTLEVNIIENVERENLSPVENAHAIRRFRIERGLVGTEGTEKIAAIFHQKPKWVTDTEELLMLTQAEQDQVHDHFMTRGESGISLAVARELLKLPESQREGTLEKARAALAQDVNIPVRKTTSVPTVKAVSLIEGVQEPEPPGKPAKKRTGKARVTAGGIKEAATGTKEPKTRTTLDAAKEFNALLDGYFDGSEALRPLHAATQELLKRISGFLKPTATTTVGQIDGTIGRIDGCLHAYYAKFVESKAKNK